MRRVKKNCFWQKKSKQEKSGQSLEINKSSMTETKYNTWTVKATAR